MKKSKTCMYKHFFCALAAVFAVFLCMQGTSAVKAGVTLGTSWNPNASVTVGNTKIRIKPMNNGSGEKAVITKNGVKKTILNVGDVCVKDEDTLYYTRHEDRDDGTFTVAIHSYNVNTGKSTKITNERDYLMLGCSGDYIYGGTDNDTMSRGDNVVFFILNAKTKEKKRLNIFAAKIQIVNGRVLAAASPFALENVPVYSFKTNGSDLVKIAEALGVGIRHKAVYYAVWDEKTVTGDPLVKVYKCSMRGKNKKAVTRWITSGEAGDKYLNM